MRERKCKCKLSLHSKLLYEQFLTASNLTILRVVTSHSPATPAKIIFRDTSELYFMTICSRDEIAAICTTDRIQKIPSVSVDMTIINPLT